MDIFSDCPGGMVEVLSRYRIGIAGCGGIGSNVAVMLARSGIAHLVLVDYDRVEPGNLNRQFFFADQVGQSKVRALECNLRRINPKLQICAHPTRVVPENIPELFGDCDLLFEAFDDSEAKAMLIEEWSSGYPDRPLIACSGIAGTGTHCRITVERAGNLSVVGDGISDLSRGTFAARVTAVAALMVSEAWSRLSGTLCERGCCGEAKDVPLLLCNGTEVPLSGFPARMVDGTVRGMLGMLKGADPDGSITLELPPRQG